MSDEKSDPFEGIWSLVLRDGSKVKVEVHLCGLYWHAMHGDGDSNTGDTPEEALNGYAFYYGLPLRESVPPKEKSCAEKIAVLERLIAAQNVLIEAQERCLSVEKEIAFEEIERVKRCAPLTVRITDSWKQRRSEAAAVLLAARVGMDIPQARGDKR